MCGHPTKALSPGSCLQGLRGRSQGSHIPDCCQTSTTITTVKGSGSRPEDGDEDINSEDEEGSIENEDEEMDDFLDDADDVAKRRMIVGDVEPVSTGLCWQVGDEVEASMRQYHIDVLDDAHLPFPIDPFSTHYWGKPANLSPVKVEKQGGSTVTVTTMQPPRLPLATVSANNTLLEWPRRLSFRFSTSACQDRGRERSFANLKATWPAGRS